MNYKFLICLLMGNIFGSILLPKAIRACAISHEIINKTHFAIRLNWNNNGAYQIILIYINIIKMVFVPEPRTHDSIFVVFPIKTNFDYMQDLKNHNSCKIMIQIHKLVSNHE